MQRPISETVTLEEILITSELLSCRPSRVPNFQAENQAMRMLIRQMTQEEETLLQTLVDTALELCEAGTTGVSLLETTPDGEEIFRSYVLAGTLAHHVGGSTPRNFSPCGVCLDHGSPVLFFHPERYFTYFQEANIPIVEGLVLPLIADHHVFGTIWIMSHDEQRHFDSEDVRIMTSLADFTATALLHKQRQTGELLAANVALEAEIVERKQAEERFLQRASLTRALISNLPGGAAFVVDQDLRYLLAEGEALAIAGFKPEDLVGHTIFEVLPSELAASYEPMYRKALAGEPFEHEHQAHDHTYISRGTPLRADNGEIYAVLAVSYDITDRKQAEAMIAADLQDTQLLHNLATRLTTEGDIQTLYQEIMAVAIALTRADAGTVQILDQATQDLLLLATQGFEQSLINHFYRVNAGSNTPCGIALARSERTFIDFDVPESEDPDGSRKIHVEAGYLCAQSTPLIARSGKAIGMVSTHWSNPHRPTERELRFLDLLARQAADLIEQRQAQQVIQESEALLQKAFSLETVGVLFFSLDGRITKVNEAFVQMSGYSRDELLKVDWEVLTPHEFMDVTARAAGELATQGETIPYEKQMIRKDGSRWWGLFAPTRLTGSGSESKCVEFIIDITERKQTEEQLRRTAELDAFRVKLSDALRSLADPVQIQAEACRLLGEHLGVDRAYYVEVNEAEGYARINQNYLRGDSPTLVGTFPLAEYGWVVPYIRRGETITVADTTTAAIVPDSDREVMAAIRILAHISLPLIKAGALEGALCVTESAPREWLTTEVELVRETAERIWATIERAHAEAELRESEIQRIRDQAAREEERQRAEALAELDRAKTLFFSNVSHEFRTPLTLSLAPLQDALSDRTHPLDPVTRERLELVHRNSLRLLKLVNTLLDFSRSRVGY